MHTVSIVSDGEGGFEVQYRGEYYNDARTLEAALEIACASRQGTGGGLRGCDCGLRTPST